MEKNAVGLKKSVLKFGETRHCSQVTFRLASVFHCRMLPGFFTIGSCCDSRLTNFYDLDPLYAHRKERRMYARLSNPRGNKSLFDIEEIRTLKHTHQDFRNNVKPVFDSISNVFVTNISTWTHESKHQHQCFAELSGFIRAGTVTCLVFRRAVTFFSMRMLFRNPLTIWCKCFLTCPYALPKTIQDRFFLLLLYCRMMLNLCFFLWFLCMCRFFVHLWGRAMGHRAIGNLGMKVWVFWEPGSVHPPSFVFGTLITIFFSFWRMSQKKRWLHSGRVQTHGASLEANVQYLDMRARQMG